MGVVFFILSGLLYIAFLVGSIAYGATAGAEAIASSQTILIACAFGLWALSAWAFLATVLPAKRFLSEEIGLDLPGFGSTVFSFAIPFANFYIPWKRLANIRNSLTHYNKTGEREEHEGGHGATILLAILYYGSTISDRIAGASANGTPDSQLAIFLFATAAWLVSFVYATFWLWTLSAKLSQARKRHVRGDEAVAEVFA